MNESSQLEHVGSIVVVCCAVVVTSLVVRRELVVPHSPATAVHPVRIREWRRYAEGDERIGNPAASVTAVVFSDYQCPFCKRLFDSLTVIEAQHPGQLRIIHRNFPLSAIHAMARPAAIAAECAAAQGRFERYHRYLFSRQDSLFAIDLTSVARAVGVPDVATFSACLVGDATRPKLLADSQAASTLRIPGTPLLIVSGFLYAGVPPMATLDSLILANIAPGQPGRVASTRQAN